MKVGIIVISFNSEKHIAKCVSSIQASNLGKINSNILLIDNNSQDNSFAQIQKFSSLPNFHTTKNQQNVGFAKAVNQGIKHLQTHANPDFFFLLNPDAHLQKDCLKILINNATESGSALTSPLIIDPATNEAWFEGGKINWLSQRAVHEKTKPTNFPKKVEFLSGCAMLISKNCIEKIGYFDEQFFLYYEDTDYSLRATKKGLKNLLVTNAKCFHSESQSLSSSSKDFHLSKSGPLFFHKHFPKFALPYFWTIFFLRLFYHKHISKKASVSSGLTEALQTIKTKR